jgi:hypothetical protein
MGSIKLFFAIELKKWQKTRSKRLEPRDEKPFCRQTGKRWSCSRSAFLALAYRRLVSAPLRAKRRKNQVPRVKSQEARDLSADRQARTKEIKSRFLILASCFYYLTFYFPEMKEDYPFIAS